MPPDTIYVGRPTAYGNPYIIGKTGQPFDGAPEFLVTGENCLVLFEVYASARLDREPEWLQPLRGKDLACWCKTTGPSCHADILLRLANQ